MKLFEKIFIQKLFRRLFKVLVFNPLIFLLLITLYCLRPVFPVRVMLHWEFRIGEFVGATELYLRRLALGMISKPRGLVFSVLGEPSNLHLVKMYRRHFSIIHSKLLLTIVEQPMLLNSPFVERLPFLQNDEFYEFNSSPPPVPFTEDEQRNGQRLLRTMGIPEGAWYVCFHARDSTYLRERIPCRDMSFTDVRNASIENYYDAMKYVASQGGYAIRIGSATTGPMADLENPRVIDYATNFRSEFGDIYLLGSCKYFVASGGGITMLSYAYNVPVINVNALALGATAPFGAKDLFLPKPIWSVHLRRFLSLPEILGSDASFQLTQNYFNEAGLEVRENSPEDILAVTQEMSHTLEGSFVSDRDDPLLLRRFQTMLDSRHVAYGMPGRISATYLRSHPEILECPD